MAILPTSPLQNIRRQNLNHSNPRLWKFPLQAFKEDEINFFHAKAITTLEAVHGDSFDLNETIDQVRKFKETCYKYKDTHFHSIAGYSYQFCDLMLEVLAEKKEHLLRLEDIKNKNSAESQLGPKGRTYKVYGPKDRQERYKRQQQREVSAQNQTDFFFQGENERWERYLIGKDAEIQKLLTNIKNQESHLLGSIDLN